METNKGCVLLYDSEPNVDMRDLSSGPEIFCENCGDVSRNSGSND